MTATSDRDANFLTCQRLAQVLTHAVHDAQCMFILKQEVSYYSSMHSTPLQMLPYKVGILLVWVAHRLMRNSQT